MSAKLEPYVFKDTGETVMIRKVSPLLVIKLRERFPAPKPPLQTVDYGDGPKQEQNPTEPGYLLAVQDYEQTMERRVRNLLIQRGVVIDWDDEKKSRLAELRAWWKETYNEDLDDLDDTFAYVSYICVGSDSDLEELVNVLIKRSQPSPEGVEAAQERFKSPVPG